jgi:hypothetical protein
MFRPFFLRCQRPAARRPIRLKIETLEERAVPATFNVNSLADIFNPGAGIVTLRSAIQAANTTSGPNTINLTLPGTYKLTLLGTTQEHDNVAGELAYTGLSDLTIVNTSGGTAIVDGGGVNRVFDLNPQLSQAFRTVTFQNFTITNGAAAPLDQADGSGGGIRAQLYVDVVLTGMVLQNNSATADGGGIAMENTSVSVGRQLMINSSLINGNHAGDSGGGIEVDGFGVIQIGAGTIITNNTAVNQGGGIWLGAIGDGVSAVTITNPGSGYTTAPTVTFSGPGIGESAGGTATIAAGSVTGVTIFAPGYGYAAAPTVTFSAPPSGTTATATVQLGCNNSAALDIAATTIANNRAITGLGGGIGNDGNGQIIINNSLIENNSAGGTGGGLGDAANTGMLEINNSTFINNLATMNGGGIQEGAITNINDTIFQGNISQGPATGPEQSAGGGLFFNGSHINMSDCVFRQNAAINGGGMVDDAARSTLLRCTFDSNHTLATSGGIGGNGGAIFSFSAGSLTILGCLFLDNTATNGSNSTGAAISQLSGTLVIQNSQFSANVCAGFGGAVSFSGTYITILTSTSNLNQAFIEGGAVMDSGTGPFAGTQMSEFANDSFFANSTIQLGGAIDVEQDLLLVNDTINKNATTTDGGGVSDAVNVHLNIENTIIALNSAGGIGPNVACENGGTVTDLGGNLVSNTSGSTGFSAGTLGSNPMIGRLENNGGALAGAFSDAEIVQTEALLPSSPAIGTGVFNNAPTTDERGFPRTAGGRVNPSIGAYEPQYASSATANQIYVENLYEVLLNRTGVRDPGAASWVAALNAGTPPPAIVAAFQTSTEYLANRVQLLFQRFLHRTADGSEQGAYINLLQHGVTFQQVIQGLAGSAEYFQLHGGTMEAFVICLYEDILNRGPAPTEVNTWLGMLGSLSRPAAVAGFVGSAEYVGDVVEDGYVNYLGRTADPAGLSNFESYLHTGGTYQILIANLFGSGEAFGSRT